VRYAKAIGRHTFSTKSFVPGHALGAVALAFGTIWIARAFIAHHKAEVSKRLAGADNARGQYGRKP
jgi:hypothetical protein